jgi:hypothetical protein
MGFPKKWNLRSKSIGLLRFSKNRQLATKTVQNSIFLGRDPHIIDHLYIMVPYMSFYGFFKKNLIFTQNPLLLAYGFSKNHRFTSNTDRNSVFSSRGPHFLYRLYIMVPYISFYGFKKKSNLRSKSISVSVRF